MKTNGTWWMGLYHIDRSCHFLIACEKGDADAIKKHSKLILSGSHCPECIMRIEDFEKKVNIYRKHYPGKIGYTLEFRIYTTGKGLIYRHPLLGRDDIMMIGLAVHVENKADDEKFVKESMRQIREKIEQLQS